MNLQTKSFNILIRCLSIDSESATNEELLNEFSANEVPWEELISLANHNLLTPALWVSLSEKKLTDNIPIEIIEYLQELHRLNQQRNESLKAQLIEAITVFNQLGVIPVLLKGSAYLILNSFDDSGARIMYDLDIMVQENKLQQCVKSLKAIGYKVDPEEEIDKVDHHHWAPLFRPGDYGAIELHHELLEYSASAILPTSDAWKEIELLSLNNFSIGVLSPTHRVLHSIVHSQVVDRYHDLHIINLRSIHDLVNILKNDEANVDWNYIKKLMKKHGLSQVLRSHLYHAHILLGLDLPRNIRPNIICYYHYFLCLAIMRWQWVANMEHKLQNYSRYSICKRFGCENKWLQVNITRAKYTLMLINRSIKNI